MAVELSSLYKDIYSEHDVRLLTTSCFHKKISWVHMVEYLDFVNLLHGDELVFNSALNDESDEIRREYIDRLIEFEAGGLIVATQDGHEFSQELIDYCNSLQFPLFKAGWETSYLNIMRRFSEILLDNERNEMNLIAALKNALYYPKDEHLYLNAFEHNGFFLDMNYIITILGCENAHTFKQLQKNIQHTLKRSILYKEKEKLILLTADYTVFQLEEKLTTICNKFPDIFVGIGSCEKEISDLHHSHKNALVSYRLADMPLDKNIICYDNLGIYQILSDLREPEIIYPNFIRNTLGKLIDYDAVHKTKYMDVLKDFFENDCSITQTANATFYHQNTLKYKIKNIKEILGYDIMSNENRVKIMISFYILRMKQDYFIEN